MMRLALILALSIPLVAEAAAPSYVPVTGYLVDDTGAPVDTAVTVRFSLYDSATGTTLLWSEDQSVEVADGQFTAYLGEVTPLTLDTFRDNGVMYLGMAVDSGAEMTPRFQVATAPYAAFAQYCEDADTVGGIDPLDLVLTGDPIDWTDLQNIPASISDGDQDTTYTAGTGLSLTGGEFAVSQSTIEGWATGVAYDTTVELRAQLDSIYAAQQSCAVNEVLASDGSGGWVCTTPAPATGSTSYVQNQTASPQAASFNVSGTAAIGGAATIGGTTTIGGNAGVGVAAPLNRLHVASGSSAQGIALYADGYNVSGLWGTRIYKKDCFDGPCNGVPLVVETQANGNWYTSATFGHGTDVNHPTFKSYGSTYLAANAGNVGIGNTNPQYKLHISGTGGEYVSERYGGVAGQTVGIWRYDTANPSYGVLYTEGTPDYISISPNGGGVANPVLHVSGNGNVGVGTNGPAARLDVAGQVAVNGAPVILIRDIPTPIIREFAFNGAQTLNITVPAMPAGARYIMADVFATASFSDHQVFSFGRGVTAQQDWVNARGVQPSTNFGALARHAINLVYTGETDGFSPNYGTWYASQQIPLNSNGSFDFTNGGNSGSTGWIYMVIRGYSL